MNPSTDVIVRDETLIIPTYPIATPDPNPMFLEHRFNQGASGRVYPNPLVDHIPAGSKSDRPYRAIYLENEYLQLILLPELGGRIFSALDKTNQYNFFYRQHVIKPALIGLFGNWISGGVEFNWPLHHRPSTFMTTDTFIEKHPDGSQTVWLSEHDPLERMKGMVGICIYPGKAYIETKVRLYNRTPLPQSFLWWHNAAVHVNDDYQIFFPPDVTHVTFHAKQAWTYFPIARGMYMGFDYGEGVDISWHKNLKEAGSIFAAASKYDFFGGYDHGIQAGVIHVADHYISPGKKLFSWGNYDFARVWQRKLTDNDGPYAELMAGVYTDNQPDFSWLQPYETKTFSQFWYPIQKIGPAKNANHRMAVSLNVKERQVKVGVYATEILRHARVSLTASDQTILDLRLDLAPGWAFTQEAELSDGMTEMNLLLRVVDADGHEVIRYAPEVRHPPAELPPPLPEPPAPSAVKTNDELYLTGLHLEQYHHPLLDAKAYWQEALRRDPDDSRNHQALGRLLLRRGAFSEAEAHFRSAIARLTRRNLNPLDGEPYYTLGLTLRFQQRYDEAYAAFSKSIWSYAWQAAGYYALAELDCRRHDFTTALDHLERSLLVNANSLKTRDLMTAVLRHLGRLSDAQAMVRQTLTLDPLDFWAGNEGLLLARAVGKPFAAQRLQKDLTSRMRAAPQTHLDIAFDYTNAGLWEEARDLLDRLVAQQEPSGQSYPMVLYTLGYCLEQLDEALPARDSYHRAAAASPLYCFPARLEELEVLQRVLQANPQDGRAAYYLGNLLYDKRQYEPAIQLWKTASQLEPDFVIPWRNLSLAYFNVRRDIERAQACYRKAMALDSQNVRLFYEYDILLRQMGTPPAERLARLEQSLHLVEQRDELYLERVALYNRLDQPQKALDLLQAHQFNPWEGGESAIGFQYMMALLLLGVDALHAGQMEQALKHFETAISYPDNLGAGNWSLVMAVPARYFVAIAREKLGDRQTAQAIFREIAGLTLDFWRLLYLPELNYYRGAALQNLGDKVGARREFQSLLDTASQKETESAYATFVPNFLVFDNDPHKVVRVEIIYLRGLAWLGLNQADQARQAFEEVLKLDVNHLKAHFELRANF